MPTISKKQRKSSRFANALRQDMKGRTNQAKAAQETEKKQQIARGTYTPPKPKKQPVWRRNAA